MKKMKHSHDMRRPRKPSRHEKPLYISSISKVQVNSINPSGFTTVETYKWADYIELLCLMNKDRMISRSDVALRTDREDDIDLTAETIAESDQRSQEHGESSIFESDLDDYGRTEEVEDRREVSISDWFKIIRYREETFSEFYPFILSDNNTLLSLKPLLTNKHRMYIFMLAASNLRYFKSQKSRITPSFERISVDALSNHLPRNAEVHYFGAGGAGLYSSTKFSGTLITKVNKLGEALHLEVRMKENKVAATNVGDEGLDIVAWLPMPDNNDGLVTLLGQCACTDDWVDKQLSSSFAAWLGKLGFTSVYINAVFIPICFRDARGNWSEPHKIKLTMVFDRLRILKLLDKAYVGFSRMPANDAVLEILAMEESA